MSNLTGNNNPYGTGGDENGGEPPIQPQRLELSLRPENGSLLTAPLLSVLLAATDGLYSDFYNMVQGEIDVTTVLAPHQDDTNNEQNNNEDMNVTAPSVVVQTKKERMAKLSFAERRHELAWRLAANGRSVQHVAALCAAAASSQLADATAISSHALQHTRTAWVQADEAQDALYFFHAQLFPGRAAPHDVYGAADLICAGHWYDLPRDLLLTVDRYQTSDESSWNRHETDERWQLAVRGKLITGEVGWMKQKLILQKLKSNNGEFENSSYVNDIIKEPLWNVALHGGVVKLTHGKPKFISSGSDNSKDENGTESKNLSSFSTQLKYPIEALLTVFPNKDPELSEWTLLSVGIHVQAKTGEFNHQLETSNRQRYDLHRLAALAMSREEARVRRLRALAAETTQKGDVQGEDEKPTTSVKVVEFKLESSSKESSHTIDNLPPPRPLHALFQVAHTFALSWQLELLSAQAQALRRGVWSAAEGNLVHVTPVRFFDNIGKVLGVVNISFWKVDDSFGPPSISDLYSDDDNISPSNQQHDGGASQAPSLNSLGASQIHATTTSQLMLSIRAEADIGIRVALSGAGHILEEIQSGDPSDIRNKQLRSTVQNLLENASNPFSLSASDALLAATKLCAELKCQAVVNALQPVKDASETSKFNLPSWIRLSVDQGSISVGARIQYHGLSNSTEPVGNDFPILFQLVCDARTGSFVCVFPRSMHVLRKLAGSDVYHASEPMAIRILNLPENRRRAASAQSSSRVVRDAFDGLTRSMNLLGQRAGVGGCWDNIDEKSSYLRERAILSACVDVESSLIKCCGMAAVYGLFPLAVGTAVGLEAVPDCAGDAVEKVDGMKFLVAPPISVLLDQQLVETQVTTSDSANRKTTYIEQSMFAVGCVVDKISLTLVPLDISVKLDSITAMPQRKSCTALTFSSSSSITSDAYNGSLNNGLYSSPPLKRQRLRENRSNSLLPNAKTGLVDVLEEVTRFASIIATTIETEIDDEMPQL